MTNDIHYNGASRFVIQTMASVPIPASSIFFIPFSDFVFGHSSLMSRIVCLAPREQRADFTR